MEDGVAELISTFTIEGRKAINILADTYGLAVFRAGSKDNLVLTKDLVNRVAQISRLVPYVTEKASSEPAVGKVFGPVSLHHPDRHHPGRLFGLGLRNRSRCISGPYTGKGLFSF